LKYNANRADEIIEIEDSNHENRSINIEEEIKGEEEPLRTRKNRKHVKQNTWNKERIKRIMKPRRSITEKIVLLETRKTGQMCHSVVKISKPYLSYS
jgi:hypothetical protein